MSRTKYLEFKGIQFKICPPINANDIQPKNQTLYDVYGRYSETKRRIWENWKHYIHSIDHNALIWVQSHNCNIFTISALIHIDCIDYYIHITPTRNDIHEILYT